MALLGDALKKDELVQALCEGNETYRCLLGVLKTLRVDSDVFEVAISLGLPEGDFSQAQVRFRRPREKEKVRFLMSVALLPRVNGEARSEFARFFINPHNGDLGGDHLPDSRLQTAKLRIFVLSLLEKALERLTQPLFKARIQEERAVATAQS